MPLERTGGILRHLRLTIAKKLALAIIGIVILCVGTMAWVTSQNLQRGFIAYLNQLQAEQLDQVGRVIEKRYEENGHFNWLRHNRREMRNLLDSVPSKLVAPQFERPTPPDDREPEQLRQAGIEPNPGIARPPRPGYGMPERQMDGRRGAGEVRPPPGPNGRRPPLWEEPRPPRDPMGLGGRLAIIDAYGVPVIGPRETPGAIERPLLVRGERIGVLRLAPIEAVSGASDGSGALNFIQSQIQTILWLALFLLLLAMLLAAMLARHFLRPVSALREVTQQLAAGQFEARAPVMNQDELSELAHHVNDMAQALQENEARRRKLLADVSHELRTPLSVIRGEIEALQDGVRKSGPQALDSLHGEVLRLSKLIDDLHQLSLADSGDLRCQRQEFDLAPMLVAIIKRYLPRAAQANLGLKLQLPPGAILLDGDPDRLTQVITNLLENSLRYTDAGGSIVVSARLSSHKLRLMVEDSAPGVAPEVLPRLFERLYRTDAARTRTSGGSGLGLSICQALVQAHGGQISAHPSPLGGVRMQIDLPLHTQ